MSATMLNAPRALVGTLNFSRRVDEEQSVAILTAAHSLGIGGINTADSDYSGTSESYVGRFLRTLPVADRPFLMVELSGIDMGVPHDPNLTPKYLRSACERSLARLGVETIDRVVVPRPSFRIPLEETLGGVQELIIDAGLALSYGVSTFPAWLTCHGQHTCRIGGLTRISSELAPYNVLDRRAEIEMLPNSSFWGMDFYAWAPLAQGLLAGRYAPSSAPPPDSRATVLGGIYADRIGGNAKIVAQRFVKLCDDFGYDPAVAAFTWLLNRDEVTGFVAGPRLVEHVIPMAAALGMNLDVEFIAAVDEVNPPGSAAADFFNSAPWMKQGLSTKREES